MHLQAQFLQGPKSQGPPKKRPTWLAYVYISKEVGSVINFIFRRHTHIDDVAIFKHHPLDICMYFHVTYAFMTCKITIIYHQIIDS